MAALMARVIKPPFVRDGAFYFPEITEEDFENDAALVPLTRGIWLTENNERLGWIDLDACLAWVEAGDCSLIELLTLCKMLDGVQTRGIRRKRYREMLREEAVINHQIVAVCKRLRAKGQYSEEAPNVVPLRKHQ
jgi:hypothetical protein